MGPRQDPFYSNDPFNRYRQGAVNGLTATTCLHPHWEVIKPAGLHSTLVDGVVCSSHDVQSETDFELSATYLAQCQICEKVEDRLVTLTCPLCFKPMVRDVLVEPADLYFQAWSGKCHAEIHKCSCCNFRHVRLKGD